MGRSNTSSVDMNTGLKMAYMANVSRNSEKGYDGQRREAGAVNASKAPMSAEQKKKAKAKAKAAKQSRKKNK